MPSLSRLKALLNALWCRRQTPPLRWRSATARPATPTGYVLGSIRWPQSRALRRRDGVDEHHGAEAPVVELAAPIAGRAVDLAQDELAVGIDVDRPPDSADPRLDRVVAMQFGPVHVA